ncbi:MAG: hypothetical protein ABI165_21250, partial [Bryobacteraceae bacterium]
MRTASGPSIVLLTAVLFTELPPAAQHLLERMGAGAANFSVYINGEVAKTEARERDGENDHLIFYVLQSRQFTRAAPIEPAISAREFSASRKIPAAVLRRFRDFVRAPANDERRRYLHALLPAADPIAYLSTEYARTMQSLHAKEFGHAPGYYQSRGHSTDTSVAANYAVWTALSVLHAMDPKLKLERVLIVGPGLDFAPRTSLDDRFPPQSYQPYAIADALIGLGL